MLIGQTVVLRNTWERDEGEMGFHDYVTHKEDINTFVNRVTMEANVHHNNVLNITYLNEDTAIIVWAQEEEVLKNE